ncbi:MAG: hypothetical protein ACR2OZ_07300 [Verrucomicrobiales bacterium]
MRCPPAGPLAQGSLRPGTEPQVLITGQSQPAIVTLDLSVPPPLDIRIATNPEGTFTLSWSALMGRGYQVQFNVDLNPANWTNLGSRVTATNTTMTTVDSTATDSRRFYRVHLLP